MFKITLIKLTLVLLLLHAVVCDQYENQVRKPYKETGFTDDVLDKLFTLTQKLQASEKTAKDLREFRHESCQVLAGDRENIEIPDQEPKATIETEWKVEQGKTLADQILFWRKIAKRDPLWTWFKTGNINACIVYNNAFKNAKEGEKPDADALFPSLS